MTESCINEVDFCSQIASESNVLIRQNPAAYPFREARVEGYGEEGPGRRKRKDLRFFGVNGKLLLCGEVKLPGTPEGRSPFDDKLCQDAEAKAGNAGVRYFFTWNVNEFVIFDRKLWEQPLLERRVRCWRLGRTLANPAAVAREDNLNFIKTHFLPDLLRDLGDVLSGVGPTGCPRTTSLSARWKATLIGPCSCAVLTSSRRRARTSPLVCVLRAG